MKTNMRLTQDLGADFWNDSCAVEELNYAIANGGVGATTNPSIVLNVLKKELPACIKLRNQILRKGWIYKI